MNGIFEKIKKEIHKQDLEFMQQKDIIDCIDYTINKTVAEYNDVIINGKYCFQTCTCTEKCNECSRLCNGSIDWYETIED